MTPDASPGRSREQVQTFDQALKLERARKGSWTSPRSLNGKEWASPAPRSYIDTDAAADFDLIIEEETMKEQVTIGDTDGPKRRSCDFSAAVKGHRSKFEVEQLFSSPGTLPKPMWSDERESLIRQLMPSTTDEMLAKVPRKLLDQATDEAQALRRKLAFGATVVFVSAGLQGKRFILERMVELGVKSVVIDHPDSWSRHLVAEGIIAKFIPVDMSQSSEQVFSQCLAHIKGLGADAATGPADGITTFIELSVPLVSRLCEVLGLPGFSPQSVDDARDKHRTRACLAAAGLPTPRNFLIKSDRELKDAAARVGFPAVLKPVSGAASLGVKKVESEKELQDCYNEIVTEMSSLVVSSGALIKGDGSGVGFNAASMIDLTLLLEQYLDGNEVDIDVVMSEGEWRYAAVQDNGPTLEPYFNETWAASPSLLPKEKQNALRDLAVSSVKALGFAAGVFHVECKYTSTGPQLIECNARMGGGQVRECNLLTWGVDLVEETLFIALGIPSRPVVSKTPLHPVAYCYVNAKKSGVMGSTDCIKDLAKQDGVVWAKPLVRPGDAVVGPDDGLPTWLCDLLVTKDTSRDALNFLLKMQDELPVEIE
jgi:carnosine synthase